MVGEAIRELTLARREVGVARAVEELCADLAELAWTECDRAAYGTGEEG